MGLTTGCNRGARASERLSHLPKVTNQEAGLTGPRELGPASLGDPSSQAPPPVLSSGPFGVAAAAYVRGVLGNVKAHFYPSKNSPEKMSPQPVRLWINGKQPWGL